MCVHMQHRPWKDGVGVGAKERLSSCKVIVGVRWQGNFMMMGKQSQQEEMDASRQSYNPPFLQSHQSLISFPTDY